MDNGETNTLVTSTIEGAVATITVDDGKANALSFDVLQQLSGAFDSARDNDDVKAVVLAGRPGKFSGGFDLSIMMSGPEQAMSLLRTGGIFAHSLYMFPKPIVFAVTGHALAMGGLLLMTPHWRVGSAGDFKLGFNEVAIGMPVPDVLVALAYNRLSPRWVTAATMLAHIFDPETAVEAGLLDEIVPPEEVIATAQAKAAVLAATLHPSAFLITRDNVRSTCAKEIAGYLKMDITD